MKLFAIVFITIACVNLSGGKTLKDYHGNKVSAFKAQRKPLASPVVNGIHDNYTRSKRHTPSAIIEFQQVINKSKLECLKEMQMKTESFRKSLMFEEHPTGKEKCLIACILKKINLMDNTNRLNTQAVSRLVGNVTNDNPLVMSIAVAVAKNCNASIRAHNACDAAYQINKCIAHEMKTYKMKLIY